MAILLGRNAPGLWFGSDGIDLPESPFRTSHAAHARRAAGQADFVASSTQMFYLNSLDFIPRIL
jgi:hypothetical protein